MAPGSLLATLALLLIPALAGAQTVAWRNGHWFDGTRFVFGTRYSVNGLFVARAPRRIDSTVEIGERFVTARDEIEFLARHRMLGNLELLRAWSVDTPRTIFPKRKLGELAPGFEADFLVLGADPLADAANLHRISLRVKAGRVLPPMPAIKLGR